MKRVVVSGLLILVLAVWLGIGVSALTADARQFPVCSTQEVLRSFNPVPGRSPVHWWPLTFAGKRVEYYIRVERDNVPGRYVTRPAKYDSASPGMYYEVLVQGP